MTKDQLIARITALQSPVGVHDEFAGGYETAVDDVLAILRTADEPPAERECKCIPQMVRTWKYCTDCGGLIPSALNREAKHD